jgi:hypothetical protein
MNASMKYRFLALDISRGKLPKAESRFKGVQDLAIFIGDIPTNL